MITAKQDAAGHFIGRGIGNHMLRHGLRIAQAALNGTGFIDRCAAGNIMHTAHHLGAAAHRMGRGEAQIGLYFRRDDFVLRRLPTISQCRFI